MGKSGYSDEQWQKRAEFLEKTLQQLRDDNVDSRTLCGRLDRGWVRWSAERRAQQRHVVRELWEAGSAGIPRAARATFLAGNDSGEKLLRLADPDVDLDPHEFFIVDAFWVETSMVDRGMAPQIDGLSPMEASRLIREEACELAERLAQLAYSELCNLLYMLNTAYMPDAAGFLRVRSGSADLDDRYGQPPDLGNGTIRAVINDYRRGAMGFDDLVAHLVSRWRSRPAVPTKPATWEQVYNRAEMKRDDDDLYWLSAAEDLGVLSLEETETIFAAIDAAAVLDGATPLDQRLDTPSSENWQYFAAATGALVRMPAAEDPPQRGQRYWGSAAGWLASSPGCRDWADAVTNTSPFKPVDGETARSIQNYLNHRPGGVFRRGFFWFDQAHRWSVPHARERVADLEAATGDLVMYWTWQEYQADLDELTRLRTFLQASDYAQAAENGNVQAMKNLAHLLVMNWNPPNLPAACAWLEKATNAGDDAAAFDLGVLLLKWSDPPDLTGARTWFEKAAAAGNTDAAHNLGALLAGWWDPPDLIGARTWYQKAAEAGNADSMFNLARLALDSDPPAARDWYDKAAAAGHGGAMRSLGALELESESPDLPRARAWLEKAAEAGETTAMFLLGVLFTSRWEPPDLPAARGWFEKAAVEGDLDAMFELAGLLSERWDPPDLPAARFVYERAAALGHADSMLNLGWLLSERFDPPELREARAWFEKAAAAGNVGAMLNLGNLLATRWDPPDIPGACEWYQRAAEAGNVAAMSDLGVLLSKRCDPADLPGARAWFEKAASAGHTKAMCHLAMLLATQWQPPEPSSSLKWLQRAATSGSEEAAALLEVLDDGTAAME
jgi:TPR repeat protein